MSVIELKKTYPVSKSIVWEHLVKPELLSKWCMPTKDFTLNKGADFKFQTVANKFWDGTFLCQVIDFKEYDFLSYHCINKGQKLDSIVKWTLTQTGNETTLTLKHSGFNGSKLQLTKMMLTSGWKQMLNKTLPNEIENYR